MEASRPKELTLNDERVAPVRSPTDVRQSHAKSKVTNIFIGGLHNVWQSEHRQTGQTSQT